MAGGHPRSSPRPLEQPLHHHLHAPAVFRTPLLHLQTPLSHLTHPMVQDAFYTDSMTTCPVGALACAPASASPTRQVLKGLVLGCSCLPSSVHIPPSIRHPPAAQAPVDSPTGLGSSALQCVHCHQRSRPQHASFQGSPTPTANRVSLLGHRSGCLSPPASWGECCHWRWKYGLALLHSLPQEATNECVALAHTSGMHPCSVSIRMGASALSYATLALCTRL